MAHELPLIELPLRDIHLPDPISWWPLAAGWWLIGGIVLIAIIIAAVIYWKITKPNLKKEASKTLDQIEASFNTTEDAPQCLSELSAFLRRVTLSRNASYKSAGITGTDWLQLLDQSLGAPEFSQGIGQILLHGPYQPRVNNEEVSQLIQLCKKWVKCL